MHYSKAISILVSGLLLISPSPHPESNKKIIIKMATLAPRGSPWVDILEDIKEEWSDLSNGQVIIRLYSGGGFGDEGALITKLRLNQIQAAAVSTKGLGVIDKGVWAFSMPTLFDSDQQLKWIREQLHDEFVERFDKAGVKLVFWMDLGWSYWFCRVPVRTPDDLRKLRIFNWAAIDLERIWKAGGFHAVRLSSIDILPGLQTGLIDCFATTPLMAATFQWFGLAKNMTRVKWGALVGGIVISNHIWDQISPDLRPKLMEAAERHSRNFQHVVKDLDEEAIAVMAQYGLQIIEITPEEKEAWKLSTTPHLKLMRGTLVDEEMYDMVMSLKAQMPKELIAQ